MAVSVRLVSPDRDPVWVSIEEEPADAGSHLTIEHEGRSYDYAFTVTDPKGKLRYYEYVERRTQ